MSDARLSPKTFDIQKQEQVCVELWKFARMQQTREHDCTGAHDTTVNLKAVSESLASILAIFGLTKADIQ